MDLLVVMGLSAVFAIAFSDLVKKMPQLFYLLAALICLLYFETAWLSPAARSLLSPLIQQGFEAYSLFAIVMFTGCLNADNWLGKRLRSCRGELAVVACILIAGHATHYMGAYVPLVLGGLLPKGNVFASFCLSVVLLLLTLLLGITSLRGVRKRMKACSWKKVQLLAYPFFALMYLHIVIMLAPSALSGGAETAMRLVVYSFVAALYVVLRARKAFQERAFNDLLAECSQQLSLSWREQS